MATLGSDGVTNEQKINKLMGSPYKPKLVQLLMKFMQFICIKLPESTYKFDAKNKVPVREKEKYKLGGLLVSIKDPFIDKLNHGATLTDRDKLKEIIQECSGLLGAAANMSALEYVYAD